MAGDVANSSRSGCDAAVVIFCRPASADARRWGWSGPAGLSGREALRQTAISRMANLSRNRSDVVGMDVLVFQDGGEGAGVGNSDAGICSWQEQRGRSFGERLADAVSRVFARGYKRLVVVGTDVPHLRGSHVRTAIEMLRDRSVVVGADSGGGCYLIGLRAGAEGALRGIQWGVGRDFSGVVSAAGVLGGAGVLDDVLRDVDGVEDLRNLAPTGLPRVLKKALDRVIEMSALRADSGERGEGEKGDWVLVRIMRVMLRAVIPTGPPI